MAYQTDDPENIDERRDAVQDVAAAETNASTLPDSLITPAWDNSTAAVERLYQHMKAQGWANEPPRELPVHEEAAPLPRRFPDRSREPLAAPVWRTQQGEIVTYGDTVALGIVEHADAVGRIIAQTTDARIQCILLRCNGCQPGTLVTVDEAQLLVRMGRPSWRRVICAWS